MAAFPEEDSGGQGGAPGGGPCRGGEGGGAGGRPEVRPGEPQGCAAQALTAPGRAQQSRARRSPASRLVPLRYPQVTPEPQKKSNSLEAKHLLASLGSGALSRGGCVGWRERGLGVRAQFRAGSIGTGVARPARAG